MTPQNRHALAWIYLTLSLGIHVWDEAAHDFLSVYNPMVSQIRTSAPYLPLPTFTFELWLTGLIIAVVVLLGLSYFAFSGRRFMIPLSYIFAVLMIMNATLHVIGSFYLGGLMPGVWSSPLLLFFSFYLIFAVRLVRRS